MIRLTTPSSNGHKVVYVAPSGILKVTEAGPNSQGIRSYVKLFDGTTVEASEEANVIGVLCQKAAAGSI